MKKSAGSWTYRFGYCLLAVWGLLMLGLPAASWAGMRWSAKAIDPALIETLQRDDKALQELLLAEPPSLTGKSDDSRVELDKAWHGIHYLLTGSALPDDTLASRVIMGGEDIGPVLGYGPAQLVQPAEVKAIAQLLEKTPPEMLRKRFDPKEMTREQVYPGVIWEREGEEALQFLLSYYTQLVAFYKRAAERGQAVIFLVS